MSASTTSGWLGLADVIVGCLLTAALGAVAFYFREMRAELHENSKHVRAVMFSLWNLVWRVDALEDFAKDKHHYVPPRAMPDWPFTTDP